jgi:uncharacterized protein
VIIGLISDTHGLLRPEALTALEGCGLIVHAGDVGKVEILEKLRAIAPVAAVRGNIDKGGWALQLPLTAVGEADSARIYVLHDLLQLDLDPIAAGFRMVVSGHSHRPGQAEWDGVLYVNPSMRNSITWPGSASRSKARRISGGSGWIVFTNPPPVQARVPTRT